MEKAALIQLLREQFNLQPYTVVKEIDEREWNELARLFVQRFQQVHDIPTDSLAWLRTFEELEKISKEQR